MAIAPLVGAQGAVSTGSSGGAVTPAYGTGSARTAGNTLVLQVATSGSATLPGAISGWTIAKQQAGTSCSVSVYVKVATGGDAAPTVPAVTSAIHNATLTEFAGLVGTVENSGGATGITGTTVATAGAADAQGGNVVLGTAVNFESAARVNTMAHTLSNGVVKTEVTNNATSTVSHYDFAYGMTTGTSTAETDSVGYTTTSLTGCAVAVVTLKQVVTATATLVDTFLGSSVDGTKWVQAAGTITVSGGTLQELATTAYTSIYTPKPYQLTGSSFVVQLTPLPIGGGTFQIGFALTKSAAGNSATGAVQINIGGSAGNVTAVYNDATGAEHDIWTIAPLGSPCWVRVRESGGTTYWDQSPDGLTWTNMTSQANPVVTDALYVSLWCGHYGAETDTTAVFDNVNATPRTLPPTLVGYDEIAYNSSSTPRAAQNGITWQANDMIVVIASNEGAGVLGAPTLSGVTFTALPGQNSGATTFSMSAAWWARPSSGGSGFVNGSCGGSGIIWGLSVWVWRGSDGIGTSAVSAPPGTATTVSLTPTDTHSALMWAATDWQGSAVGATVGTPTPTHTDESALEGGNYSEYVYDLVDLASIAPQSLGVSGNATTGPWTVLGVEVLGSHTLPVPQLAPIASAGGAVVARVTAAAALASTATAVAVATGAITVPGAPPAIVATSRATGLATATVTAAAVSSFILDCV